MMYLFPFEKINRDERVVVYGAGIVGQQFLRQIETTKYCSIVAIVDQNYSLYIDSTHKIFPVENIAGLSYDKIVIAIDNPNVAHNVLDKLIQQYNVSETCIVAGCNRKIDFEDNRGSENSHLTLQNSESDTVSIAFSLIPALGDLIIAKVFVESFMKTVGTDLRADIYTSVNGFMFVQAVFGENNPYIGRIVARKSSLPDCDLVISVTYGLQILAFREERVRKLNPGLAEAVIKLQEKIQAYRLDFKGAQYRIHFDRCRAMGYTCYTAFNYYDICKIVDWHTEIPLLPEAATEYENLQLGKYITINFGWGGSDGGIGKPPNKIWPLKQYEVFVRLFRKVFPDFQIVQIGLANSNKISCADAYIFGESLELVKYVLKNAMIHIDCEGGLVHLASQLGTKCVVLFGPTPVYYFGYEDNLNIVSEQCNDCYYMYDDFSVCARGLDEPECMNSIAPEMVLEKVVEYFAGLGIEKS